MSHILPHCIDMMSHKQYYKQSDRSDMHFHNKSHMTHHLLHYTGMCYRTDNPRHYIDMPFDIRSDSCYKQSDRSDMLFHKHPGMYYKIDMLFHRHPGMLSHK